MLLLEAPRDRDDVVLEAKVAIGHGRNELANVEGLVPAVDVRQPDEHEERGQCEQPPGLGPEPACSGSANLHERPDASTPSRGRR